MDYAATTPMSDVALNAYGDAARTYFGNTNSLHDAGTEAAQVYEWCRQQIGHYVGADGDHIYFTSGGSASNQLAVSHWMSREDGQHVIMSAGEHNSVQTMRASLEHEGFRVSIIPFRPDGRIDLEKLNDAISEDTALVCVQHVNGEMGSIQPIHDVADLCRRYHAKLHVDAVQSFGKLDLSKMANDVDSLAVTSHKLYGPKGVGALYLRDKPKTALTTNTIDLPSVVAFTAASEEAVTNIEQEEARFQSLRQTFKRELMYPDYVRWFEAGDQEQLPSIVGMAIHHMDGQYVMLECNRQNIAISTGSACDSRYEQHAHVTRALQMDDETARQFFRVSFGRYTTHDDVKKLAACLNELIELNVLDEVNSDGQPTTVQ
ncbi:cysteine desulfurase family protein [Alkalibacillus flavidus]